MSESSPQYNLMQKWVIGHMTLCSFAASLLRTDSITLYESDDPFDGVEVAALNGVLDFSGMAKNRACVLMFPSIREEENIVTLVRRLEASERWRCAWKMQSQTRDLNLEWLTEEGKWSSCMGFAPLLTMPPTRRAPYVAIALWPGKARDPDQSSVDFKHIPSPIDDDDKRKAALDRVRADVRELVGDTDELYDLTFRLSN